jgi:hypothetical protein
MVPFIIQLCSGTIIWISAVSKPLNQSQEKREANKLPRLWLCADERVLHTLTAAPGFGIGPLLSKTCCQVLVIVLPAVFVSRTIPTWTQHLPIIFCHHLSRTKAIIVDLVHNKGRVNGGRDVSVSLWCENGQVPATPRILTRTYFDKVKGSKAVGPDLISRNHRGASRSSIAGTCRVLFRSQRSCCCELLAPFKNLITVQVRLLAHHHCASLGLLLCLVAHTSVFAIAVVAAANQSANHFRYRELAWFVVSIVGISLNATTFVHQHFKSLV